MFGEYFRPLFLAIREKGDGLITVKAFSALLSDFYFQPRKFPKQTEKLSIITSVNSNCPDIRISSHEKIRVITSCSLCCRLFGIGNLSSTALEGFKSSHHCNLYCTALGLPGKSFLFLHESHNLLKHWKELKRVTSSSKTEN